MWKERTNFTKSSLVLSQSIFKIIIWNYWILQYPLMVKFWPIDYLLMFSGQPLGLTVKIYIEVSFIGFLLEIVMVFHRNYFPQELFTYKISNWKINIILNLLIGANIIVINFSVLPQLFCISGFLYHFPSKVIVQCPQVAWH